MAARDEWIVAITGASGSCYARRLLQELASLPLKVHVVISEAGLRVLADEEEIRLSATRLTAEALIGSVAPNIEFHSVRDIGASIASGSKPVRGMVICPCSMSTLGALACGAAQNLIHRAAEVTMKEGRRLIVVPRETPLSAIHLENMLRLSRLGVRIVPAMPGFYHRPTSLQEVVDMQVMKILDQMGIERNLVRRWGTDTEL